MAVTEIQAGKNGPYRMEGGVVVSVDAQGNETVVEKPRISLCRCGQSNSKPFCDGTHKTCGFVADELVVRWSSEP
jgi:CDGSH iron-sulfur domain-containing protein 3